MNSADDAVEFIVLWLWLVKCSHIHARNTATHTEHFLHRSQVAEVLWSSALSK